MATKLFLRITATHGITDSGDNGLFDMSATAGTLANSTDVSVDTAAGGTEIQLTSAAGAQRAWISGRVPAGGFTLTSTDISVWMSESSMSANCGGRYRVFRYQPGGIVTELGGGPFNDGVEFSVAPTFGQMTWIGNVTDTAFLENDRILLRIYITNVGTMAGGFTCALNYDAPDGTTGGSFLNIAETVAFKNPDAPPIGEISNTNQAVNRASTY